MKFFQKCPFYDAFEARLCELIDENRQLREALFEERQRNQQRSRRWEAEEQYHHGEDDYE